MKYWDDDRAVGCKRLVAKGPQHFYDRNNGHNGENRLNIIEPGTFELYLFQTSTHFLFVGWRYADAVENEIKPIKLEDLAALSLSTVRMLPVATTPTKDAAANPKGAKK